MELSPRDGTGNVGERRRAPSLQSLRSLQSLEVAVHKVPKPASRDLVPPAPTTHKPSAASPACWAVCLGTMLAFCAGIVNVVAFFFFGGFISHTSGQTAQIALHIDKVRNGIDASRGLLRAALLVICFLFGAFLSGMLLEKSQVQFAGKSRYGLTLLLNAALLFAAMSVTVITESIEDVPQPNDFEAVLPACLATIACGLQNSMCTIHFSGVMRTTHVTGTVTDMGAVAGRIVMMMCRRHFCGSPIDRMERNAELTKLRVLFPLFSGFIVGSFVGSVLCTTIGVMAVIVPACFTGLIGIVCLCFRGHLALILSKFEVSRPSAELQEVKTILVRTRNPLRVAAIHNGFVDEEDDFTGAHSDDDALHVLRVVSDNEVSIASKSNPHRWGFDIPGHVGGDANFVADTQFTKHSSSVASVSTASELLGKSRPSSKVGKEIGGQEDCEEVDIDFEAGDERDY